jgi:RNA polymerase sigma-70 factor (ECF subfamily)
MKMTTCLLAAMLALLPAAPRVQAGVVGQGVPAFAHPPKSAAGSTTRALRRRREGVSSKTRFQNPSPSHGTPVISAELSPSHRHLVWDQFYSQYNPRVRELAEAYRGRGVDVEECAQDVWLDLIEKLPGFRVDPARGEFHSWLAGVVRNKAVNQIRRQARRPTTGLGDDVAQVCDPQPGPPERYGRREEQLRARQFARDLPSRLSPDACLLLQMRYLEGKPIREVADALGMTPAHVSVAEHRAKSSLRRITGFQPVPEA